MKSCLCGRLIRLKRSQPLDRRWTVPSTRDLVVFQVRSCHASQRLSPRFGHVNRTTVRNVR